MIPLVLNLLSPLLSLFKGGNKTSSSKTSPVIIVVMCVAILGATSYFSYSNGKNSSRILMEEIVELNIQLSQSQMKGMEIETLAVAAQSEVYALTAEINAQAVSLSLMDTKYMAIGRKYATLRKELATSSYKDGPIAPVLLGILQDSRL